MKNNISLVIQYHYGYVPSLKEHLMSTASSQDGCWNFWWTKEDEEEKQEPWY